MARFVKVETGNGSVWVNPDHVHFIVPAMSGTEEIAHVLLGHTAMQLTGQSELMIVRGNPGDIAAEMSDETRSPYLSTEPSRIVQ